MHFSASIPCTRLAGLPISRLDQAQTLDLLSVWMRGPSARRVATANVDFLQRADSDPAMREALVSADLVTADGMPLVWWSRMLGEVIPQRVTGSDLVEPLVARAAREGHGVYFLGGLPGAAAATAAMLQQRHPELRVAGVSEARVDLQDTAAMAVITQAIRDSGAALLLVALGSPKQELFLHRHLADTGARVGLGIGATFDFLSGRIRRAPKLMRRCGLEWLFRAATEPARLGRRYLQNIPFALRMTVSILLGAGQATTTRRPAAMDRPLIG